MDLARWARSVVDLPTQPALEHSLRLAVPAIDARYQGRRTRRNSRASSVFLATDAAGQSFYCAHLARRSAGLALLAQAEALPVAGAVLCGLLHRALCASWQELLSGADLSHAPGRRGCSSGICDRPAHRS